MKLKRQPAPGTTEACEGLLLVDKPSGPTSHDVVDEIRRQFGIEKVGHGGTLDPMATGLLVVLLGRGTKLSNYIMGTDKIYEGVMCLGTTTDTEDIDGKIVSEADMGQITREQLEQEMAKWVGDVLQTPPMVSAVKRDGVPLYKLARKGKIVDREPRRIHLYEFTLMNFTPPRAHFRLRCTKGTYVRTLCADIGRALGCGAFLEQLRRTQSGSLKADQAVAFETILAMNVEQLAKHVIPIHQILLDQING